MRFKAASDDGRSEERCEPTNTIGTGRFWHMKVKAAAVWAKVSVPWPMTMPSMPFWISSPIFLAKAMYSLGDMFSENTANTFSVSRLQMSASSGTAP